MSGEQTQIMLQAWQDARSASPGERGLVLLRVAQPDAEEEVRGSLSVGRRDAALLDLYGRLFGQTAPALVDCPGCGEQLELDVPITSLRARLPTDDSCQFVLTWSGQEITYRLPTALDLAALGAELDGATVASAARALAERCVLGAAGREGSVQLDDLAAAALQTAIGESIALSDPQAVVNLDFDCPECGVHWLSRFDIVEFLWRRFDGLARGLLEEVHALAMAYGWSERDILALPSWRRRHYLGLVGA